MSDAADDLEALFDEVAAHRVEPVAPPAGETAAPAAADATHTGDDQPSKPMYERLGGIVRMLHDSLRQLGYDRSLADVASQITDAQGRLEHIGALTEQAANKVLNTVDTSLPQQEALSKNAKDMQDR